jgi:hypothetical protein
MDGWMDGRIGWMDGRTDGRTDGWMDGRTDHNLKCLNEGIYHEFFFKSYFIL